MALPATDDFNRADGALGGIWTNQVNAGDIASNKYRPNGGAFGYEYDGSNTYPDDQYSQATLGQNLTGSEQYVGITVRASVTGASFNNYFLYCNGTDAFVGKNVSGAFTSLQTFTGASAFNVVFKLTVAASVLQAFKAGVQLGTDQSDGALTSGSAGIGGFLAGGNTRLDDWEGGALTSSVTSNPAAGALLLAGLVAQLLYQINMPDEP